MSTDDRKTARTTDRRLLRCDVCGYSRDCSPEASLRYTREGWPKCCGQVMVLFAEAEKPGPDDTAPDVPPLPAG